MNTKMQEFRQDIDEWVKQLKSEVEHVKGMRGAIKENNGNIQHNYELVKEMQKEIDELRYELKMMKLMQMMVLKQKIND